MSGSANGCGAARRPGSSRIPASPLSRPALTSQRFARRESKSSPIRSTRTHAWFAEQTETMAPTQDALYRDLELDLSWSERELPERERTKHVHRLHPYLGKFIPQLVEAVLSRYFVRGQHVLDPFAGSGTTLVQALESGLDATGADIAAFNCLLMEVKTRDYNPFVLERELRAACDRVGEVRSERARGYVRAWFAPELDFGGPFDGVVTSPPYPGLIDYHEQHRYAYELLGLDDFRELEVGPGAFGTSKSALAAYRDGIVAALANVQRSLRPGAPVV